MTNVTGALNFVLGNVKDDRRVILSIEKSELWPHSG